MSTVLSDSGVRRLERVQVLIVIFTFCVRDIDRSAVLLGCDGFELLGEGAA
jgi:hypothetical protein